MQSVQPQVVQLLMLLLFISNTWQDRVYLWALYIADQVKGRPLIQAHLAPNIRAAQPTMEKAN